MRATLKKMEQSTQRTLAPRNKHKQVTYLEPLKIMLRANELRKMAEAIREKAETRLADADKLEEGAEFLESLINKPIAVEVSND